jgi:hypothetical protein
MCGEYDALLRMARTSGILAPQTGVSNAVGMGSKVVSSGDKTRVPSCALKHADRRVPAPPVAPVTHVDNISPLLEPGAVLSCAFQTGREEKEEEKREERRGTTNSSVGPAHYRALARDQGTISL